MAPRTGLNVLLRIMALGLFGISFTSLANDVSFAQLSSQTLSVSYAVIAGIILAILILIVVCKFKLSAAKKSQNKQAQQVAAQTGLMDDFRQGIVHLDKSENVLFCNKTAASFLGSSPDKLLNQSFVALFDENTIDTLNQALSANQYVNFQTYLNTSKRFLHIGISHASVALTGVAKVISLADVSNYQDKINKTSDELTYLNTSIEHNHLGRLSIDFEENTYTADDVFINMFEHAIEKIGELKSLNNRVNKTQVYDWEQALKAAISSHNFDMRCELAHGSTSEIKVQGSQPIDSKPEDMLSLRFIGLSKHKNTKGETSQMDFVVHDLSALAAQENLNKANKVQIKTLLTSSPNPIYVVDIDAKVIDCNLAFERLFKLKKEKILQQTIYDLGLWPEDINKLHSGNSNNVASANMSKDKEFQTELTSGKVCNFKLRLQHIVDEQNQRSGMIGIIQDVTELRQVKAELIETKKHFTTILDLAPIAVATIDADDKIITANIAMTDRLGISERDLKKDSFYQLFNDPSNAGKAAKLIHQSGRLRQFNAQLKGKNGELHVSSLHVDLLNKDKQEYLCWISDRTGEQFQQDKFESLLQHSSMPMAILGEEGFTQLNPAACEFFKIEDEEALFGAYPYSASLNKDEIAVTELERQVTKVKLDGQAKFFRWEHQVGQEILPCQVTYVPMYKGQEFDSILCIWMDFRELQQADQARLEALNLRQEAEKQVAEKQEMLESSQAQLASKSQNLADTVTKLQAAQEDLSEKQHEFSSLQEAHENITHNLQALQQDYKQSRSLLDEAQSANVELTTQLQESAEKVSGLQNQRNQISDALQHSEKKFKTAQQNLIESERNAENLKQQQLVQQTKMKDFANEIEQLQGSIAQKDKQIHEVGSQINSLQSQLASSDNTSEKLRQSLINQRKASEQAENQRRQLEKTCQMAQSELTNKVRHVEHLQSEMQKFEEMSTQQKGDMEKQQSQLLHELQEKQAQLKQTQADLDETKQAAEKEKQAKQKQQAHLQQLEQDLAEMEQKNQQQKQKMATTEQEWQQQQQKIQQELIAKQDQLQQAENSLELAKQQSEAEKAEKERQQSLFEQLQTELSDMEVRNKEQEAQIAKRDQEWQVQQDEMQKALKDKQQELQQTEQNLNQAKQQTQAEKAEQQALFEKLQTELVEMEARNASQEQKMAQADKDWQLQQQKVQQELQAKQEQLQQTENVLIKAKQHAEAERAEKEQQQALFEKLQSELIDMEHRSAQQKQKIAQSDEDWHKQQQVWQDEVEAKRQQLSQTQGKLAEIQNQADAEKMARLEHQHKLEQLTVELTDVETRASKQKEMIEGSDEEWRKHHAEIEQQKFQLQKALQEAEQKNSQLKEKLEGNLEQLEQAESQVSETQSGEQKLQQELDNARKQADELANRLKQQEQHENKLQQQLQEQQASLQGNEQNIHSLEARQAQLTQALEAVQKEYSASKESLDDKHNDHSQLSEQLKKLENELQNSKQQLDNKELALQDAQQQIQSKESMLAEQESALLAAHKEELQQAQQQALEQGAEAPNETLQEIAKLSMPAEPAVWFDLLHYLQKQTSNEPLPVALKNLMEELQQAIEATEQAVDDEDLSGILRGARKLGGVANNVNSAALTDVVNRLETDCEQGLVDNISIAWPSVKRSLNNSLRVIYSNLNS
ncbi:PAS domain S-box protein [Paraglaciecola aquimarina]|uniref:PAS domain S-box protein n=1 Tax=Paraglaciecola algarum TaxID=3050085 RepID=A0ABS9D0Z9_9ALTE|nr:PAS domain S-box protein [Paraglaciecola sp. G1-23]MCF2946606.1 PAS domain S-box protein [Paraglaciecola sp. G1-23]